MSKYRHTHRLVTKIKNKKEKEMTAGRVKIDETEIRATTPDIQLKDITDEVVVKLIKSQHADGVYCAICHGRKMPIVFSPVNTQNIKVDKPYHLLRTEGATYSFRVYIEV